MRAYRSSDPLGAATAQIKREIPTTINAPLFRSLIERLAEDQRWVILDLGVARPQILALLNRCRCRLDIADLADAVHTLIDVGDSVCLANLAEALLPAQRPEPTDIVFCWDFLNYLERGALTALMASIAVRCRPGAYVHALIVYSERLMQQRPGQFAPIDEGHLLNLSTSEPVRTAPRYSPEDLQMCMPEYTIERVRLLSNGMQEYLFRL